MRISDWSSDVCSSDLGDAAAVRHRLAARGLDFLDDLERGVRMAGAAARAAEIVDDDLRAAPREFERIGADQAAASTGDDGDAIIETEGHGKGAPRFREATLLEYYRLAWKPRRTVPPPRHPRHY